MKRWNDYLWLFSSFYFIMGFFNIMFAWIGLICFVMPLTISILGGGKAYCNLYCGRGQLLNLLGNKLHLSAYRDILKVMKSKLFRYGFLIFFMVMFCNMVFSTYLVFSGASSLKETLTLFWVFKLPWDWGTAFSKENWVAQFSFGFYSLMLTSTLLGFITMVLFKPRSWCVYCPMGTMTQLICQLKLLKKGDEKWKKEQKRSQDC